MGISPRQERRRLGILLGGDGASCASGAFGRSVLRWLGLMPFLLDRVGVVDFVLLRLLTLVMLGDLPPPSLVEERIEVEERDDKVRDMKSSSSSSDEKPLVAE